MGASDRRGIGLVLLSLLFGCDDWAPFDEGLLDPPESDDRGRGGRADAARDDGDADGDADADADADSDADADTDTDADADTDSDADADADGDADADADAQWWQEPEIEPNDSMEQAQPVDVRLTVLAEWSPEGDDDWYVMSLLRGQKIGVYTRDDDGSCHFDSILLVYDDLAVPRRDVLDCDEMDGDPAALGCVDDYSEDWRCAAMVFTVPADGTFYFRAVEWGDDQIAAYSIDFFLED